MIVLDTTVVNVALPSIQHDLRFSASSSGLGDERLPDRLRRPDAAGRTARRPALAARGVSGRTDGVHHGFTGLRAGLELGAARRRSLHPGHRRRHDRRGHAGDDRDHVPRAARAGQGDRRLRVRGLRRGHDRAARRRRPDPGHRLALDLLRQPAHRRRHRASPPSACCRPTAAPGLAAGADATGAAAHHQLADARRLHDRRAGRPARLGRDSTTLVWAAVAVALLAGVRGPRGPGRPSR